MYKRSCFPNEKLFDEVCAALIELPDDKMTVYNSLNKNSFF